MITKIELHNFQSHKNTVLEFDKGVNVICGETDNGKSAVIRAIRWVVENFPSGTETINSRWNKDFKEPMSVVLYTENGKIERIRSKTRNGYNILKNGCDPVELDAIGKGNVPKEVTDFLNVSDVNFQFQLDQPYLLTKTPGQASQYLNEIVHLDSIDKIMSLADSDKRQLSSEQKVIESDIKKLEEEVKNYEWVDEADKLFSRVNKLYEITKNTSDKMDRLEQQMNQYERLEDSIINLSEHNELIDKIEKIDIFDTSSLIRSIENYENCEKVVRDLSEHNELVNEIDSIILDNTEELKTSIEKYEELDRISGRLELELSDLKDSLPEVCPYCGSRMDKEKLCS